MHPWRITASPDDKVGECDLLINHMEFSALDAWPTRAMRRRNAESVIVLVDRDHEHRVRLESALQDAGYVVACSNLAGIEDSSSLDRVMRPAKAVVFDLTTVSSEAWRRLRQVCRYRPISGVPVPVICPTRVDHGPAFELFVERLGAQLLYEI
jgi:hypothetical protein